MFCTVFCNKILSCLLCRTLLDGNVIKLLYKYCIFRTYRYRMDGNGVSGTISVFEISCRFFHGTITVRYYTCTGIVFLYLVKVVHRVKYFANRLFFLAPNSRDLNVSSLTGYVLRFAHTVYLQVHIFSEGILCMHVKKNYRRLCT